VIVLSSLDIVRGWAREAHWMPGIRVLQRRHPDARGVMVISA
jgi:hypothetical protein